MSAAGLAPNTRTARAGGASRSGAVSCRCGGPSPKSPDRLDDRAACARGRPAPLRRVVGRVNPRAATDSQRSARSRLFCSPWITRGRPPRATAWNLSACSRCNAARRRAVAADAWTVRRGFVGAGFMAVHSATSISGMVETPSSAARSRSHSALRSCHAARTASYSEGGGDIVRLSLLRCCRSSDRQNHQRNRRGGHQMNENGPPEGGPLHKTARRRAACLRVGWMSPDVR